MDHAVIQTGGKQYLVKSGDTIVVEKLPGEAGEKITFSEVLLSAAGDTVTLGGPLLENVTIEGKIVRHGRHDKVTGVKMKAKKRRKKYFGHKQHFTEVEITKIA